MVVKIKSADSTFIASQKNETFVVDANTDLVFLNSDVCIQAADKVGGRTIRVDGSVDATVAGANAIQLDCSFKVLERIIVGSGGEVSATSSAIATGFGGRVDIRNAGRIQGDGSAIGLSTDRATVRNSGTIEGGITSAVIMLAGDTLVKNSGQIISDGNGAIRALADGCTIVNSGNIEGTGTGSGISVVNGDFSLVNTGTVLSEGGTAVVIGTFAGVGSATIVNDGAIVGVVDAIEASSLASGDTFSIVNTGSIIGNINLSGSVRNDVVDNSNGLVIGDIRTGEGDDRIVLVNAIVTGLAAGGQGDDVYTVSRADAVIAELADEGTDTVRTTDDFSIETMNNVENIVLTGARDAEAVGNKSDNILSGNSGDNVIDGAAGNDTIRGGKGRDQLFGGDDVDTFIFRTGDGRDLIADFDPGADHDVIDLSNIQGIVDFDDLIDNHAIVIDGDVVIDTGKGVRIALDVALTDLRAGIFVF